MVIAIYATFISILHIRARKSWNEQSFEATRALHEAQSQAARLATFIAARPAGDDRLGRILGVAEIEGDPGLLIEANASQRVLSFSNGCRRMMRKISSVIPSSCASRAILR